MAALARDALVRCAMVCGRRCSGAIRCDLASWFSQCLADDPANIAGNPDCSFRPRVYYALCGSTASRECLLLWSVRNNADFGVQRSPCLHQPGDQTCTSLS